MNGRRFETFPGRSQMRMNPATQASCLLK